MSAPEQPAPVCGADAGSSQVFAGLRVIDLSRYVPGEYCTKLFADFGADVVKVERPEDGSLTRRTGPFPPGVEDPEASALFLHLNTNKRSVAIDLASPRGRHRCLELAATADLVVESFRPGALERLGLSYNEMRSVNPRLVLTRISNFGQDGPRRDDEASALVLEALGGPMYSTGGVNRPPLRKPGHLSLYVVGRAAALASLGALTCRRRSGRGALIDVSAYEVLLGGADRRAPYLQTALYSGAEAPRGVRSPHRPLSISPAGPFPCKDGFVMLYVTEEFFPRFLDLLGDPQLTAELTEGLERYRRLGEGDEGALGRRFRAVLEPWLARRGKLEVMELAESLHLPVTAILSMGEVLENAHFRERVAFVEVDHPVAGRLNYPARPWRMRGGWAMRRPAPTLGQHTAEILDELDSARGMRSAACSGGDLNATGGSRSVRGSAARADRTGTESPLPLSGVRVLDLTVVWAGPGGTMLLGDLGAEVIRIESVHRPTRGAGARVSLEEARRLGYAGAVYPGGDPGERPYNRSANFNWHGRNKLSVTLPPLDAEDGRQALLDLASISDVLIENNAARTLPKLGLDYPQLSAVNPRIIVVRMPALGLDGPMHDYVGYGANFNALTGIAAMDGYEGEDPTSAGENYHMDESTPAAVAFATVAALWERESTGVGQLVEFAQAEQLLQEVGGELLGYQMTGVDPPVWGNGHGSVLQDVLPAAEDDRWVALTVCSGEQWRALCELVDGLDATLDAKARHEKRELLRARLADWTRARPVAQSVQALVKARLAAGEVQPATRVPLDAHLEARHWFQTRFHPEVGEYRYGGHGWRSAEVPQAWGRPFPSLGEDNEYVFLELLGWPRERYEEAVASGRIGTTPRR